MAVNSYEDVIVRCADPSQWSTVHVRHWLQWAVANFNLDGIDAAHFQCVGLDLLRQGRDRFLLRAPPYVGDILWEHLEILQKGWNHRLCALTWCVLTSVQMGIFLYYRVRTIVQLDYCIGGEFDYRTTMASTDCLEQFCQLWGLSVFFVIIILTLFYTNYLHITMKRFKVGLNVK